MRNTKFTLKEVKVLSFGISSYKPIFFNSEEKLLESKRFLLKSIEDKTLKNIYWAWDIDKKDWLEDLPVVLEFDYGYIAVLNNKLDEVAIDLVYLNIHKNIDWHGTDFNLVWKSYEEANFIFGKTLKKVEVSYEDSKKDINYGNINGFAFTFEDYCLKILNYLDKNGIEVINYKRYYLL